MKRVLIIICLVFIGTRAYAEQELADHIVAVINEKVILQSEVDEAVGLYFTQQQKIPTNSEVIEARQRFLTQMIDNMILVEEAKKEDIQVQSSEINQALEETITNMKENFPSDEAFERQLEKEGMTLAELRARYREEIRHQLLINRYIDLKIRSGIDVSAQEVRALYEEKKDEFPENPATVTISHILIPVRVGPEREKEIVDELQKIRQRAVDGQDFGELAKQYSDGPLAENGGSIGFFKRGDMMPDFEKVAFKLQVNEVSRPVKTDLGYHIIKVTDKKSDDEIEASHILMKITPGQSDSLRAVEESLEVFNRIQNGENFQDLVPIYSIDENTRESGGDLGTFPLQELISPYQEAIRDLEVGEISRPILGEYGYHLVRLDGKQASRPLNFEDIRGQLEEMVRQEKMRDKYDEMLEKVKSENYIEIRDFL